MITLYKFGAIGDLADPSPFCVKVEAYLRLSGLPYDCKSGMHYMRTAPKGKMPFITDEGDTIPDSQFIIAYLKKKYGDKVDGHLTDEQRAIAHAFVKMMDENLYWCVVHSRWIEEQNWPKLKNFFFGKMRFPLGAIVARVAQKRVRKSLYAHGLGRHSGAEIVEIGARDIKALADFLGDKNYFFGDQPSSLDAMAYATLVQMIKFPHLESRLYEAAKGHQNLVDFVNRFHEKYFSEVDEASQT